MILGLQMIENNLGIAFEIIITIIFWLGGLIFYAKDVRLGNWIHILMFSGIFVWFYQTGLEWTIPLIIMILHIIFLTFTLYATYDISKSRGFI